MRIDKSLPIYECILCDKQNIIRIKARYSGRWITPEFSVSVHTNDRGYREEFNFDDSDVDVAFMGDSFTFGHGVNVDRRYSNVFARANSHLKTASLSYNNGFQPEHYEYFLDIHPRLSPKFLFIGVYLGNDLEADLNETVIERNAHGKITRLELPYREVYQSSLVNALKHTNDLFAAVLRTNLGKIIAMRINSSPRLRHILLKEGGVVPNAPNRLSTELGHLGEHNLRAIVALKQIAKTSESRKSELHILLIPQNFVVGNVKNPHMAANNRDRINEIRSNGGLMSSLVSLCKTAALKCHDLSKLLTSGDYFDKDAHWNERGHEKVGNYVRDIVVGSMSASSTQR